MCCYRLEESILIERNVNSITETTFFANALAMDIAYAMQLLRELFAYTLAKPPGSHSHNTIAHHFHNVRYVCR